MAYSLEPSDVERRGRVQVGHRVAAHELRHLDDPAAVGFGQTKNLALVDERLDLGRRRLRLGHEGIGRAVVLGELREDPRIISRRPCGIIGRDRLAGKEIPPELSCDHGHLGLDPSGLSLGLGQHLVGRDARVEFEVELLDERLAANPPILRGPGKHVVPKKRHVVLERGHDRLGLGSKLPLTGRCTCQGEQLLGVEPDGPLGLTDGRFDLDPGRIRDRPPGRSEDRGDLFHAAKSVIEIGLPRE